MDSELERRNNQLGWALFLLFVLVFLGTFAVALIYLQFD